MEGRTKCKESVRKERKKNQGGGRLGNIFMYSIQCQVSKFSKSLRGNWVTVVGTSLMTVGAEKFA